MAKQLNREEIRKIVVQYVKLIMSDMHMSCNISTTEFDLAAERLKNDSFFPAEDFFDKVLKDEEF